MDSFDMEITLNELRTALKCNREIELSLKSIPYFMQPCTDPPLPICYQIWDVLKQQCIFQGGLNETIVFGFPGGYTLDTDFDEFDILYIL